MLKSSHTKRLSIPCLWEAPKAAQQPLEKPSQGPKFKSGRNSPQQSILSQFKIPLKCATRQHSPKSSQSIRNSPPRQDLKPKVPSHVVKRKKKVPKKVLKSEEKLTIIEGSSFKYAPKIYQNQIFSDVYDEMGRHDRIMEFELSMDTLKTDSPRLIIVENVQAELQDEEGLKPPENSFTEETCQDSRNLLSDKGKCNLFAKLELMAKYQD